MKQISANEAKELLFSCDAKYVSQEQSSIYYDNFSGRIKVDTYICYDCLVLKSDNDWHIHAIGADSDISRAIKEVKEIMDTSSEKLMVLTWDNIPDELSENKGAYKFARCYEPYADNYIRELKMTDFEQVKDCCLYDPEDNPIGQNIANDFLTYYSDFINDPNATNLGLFEDNSLVGFVQAFEQKELELSTVNIYVKRSYRNNGYAKRLLSAICATSENTVYCYSCVKRNVASINTAKSCGFQFMGAYLFV